MTRSQWQSPPQGGAFYARQYLGPMIDKDTVANLMAGGFDYHLPASNEMGYWTHPDLPRQWLTTRQALGCLQRFRTPQGWGA